MVNHKKIYMKAIVMKFIKVEDRPNKKIYSFLGIKFSKKKVYDSIYQDLLPREGISYEGNDEYGIYDLNIRLNQPEFEYYDMVAVNKAIGDYFIGDAKKVVNIGAGVGTFEFNNAPKHSGTMFVASEFDRTSGDWAKENRPFDNVEYCSDGFDKLLSKHGKFDLAVTIDVIEHVKDYKAFLDGFVKLADRAVISTPNRDRYHNIQDLRKPPYPYHTHEFNAGELYFILKMYYKNVQLFSQINPASEELVKVGIYSDYEKLTAYCSN